MKRVLQKYARHGRFMQFRLFRQLPAFNTWLSTTQYVAPLSPSRPPAPAHAVEAVVSPLGEKSKKKKKKLQARHYS